VTFNSIAKNSIVRLESGTLVFLFLSLSLSLTHILSFSLFLSLPPSFYFSPDVSFSIFPSVMTYPRPHTHTHVNVIRECHLTHYASPRSIYLTWSCVRRTACCRSRSITRNREITEQREKKPFIILFITSCYYYSWRYYFLSRRCGNDERHPAVTSFSRVERWIIKMLLKKRNLVVTWGDVLKKKKKNHRKLKKCIFRVTTSTTYMY
jgi:hypothetical protein